VTRDASPSEVKSGYRRLALQHHPDREAAGTEDVRDVRKAKFQEISEAYTVLSDPTRKARYDAGESLETLLQPGGGGPDPFILFNVVCGVLPDDAALPLRALHRLKQCGFWTAVCVMGATTCPCWCPALWCAPAPRDRD
jgi:curved DNA-binding protein CbpA